MRYLSGIGLLGQFSKIAIFPSWILDKKASQNANFWISGLRYSDVAGTEEWTVEIWITEKSEYLTLLVHYSDIW